MTGAVTPGAPVAVPDVLDTDATVLAARIAAREVSCVEVMTAHLTHVERLAPAVTALVGRRDPDDCLADARAADDDLARGRHRGFLHGMPLAVKDLAEARGLPWTAGSPVFADRVGVVDALHVARMRAAGGIVVAKTATPELGYGSQTYNPLLGVTVNPYDPTRTVGGSSGGAAAALALRMLPVADGSDYMGSLRNPAAFANVLGLRPSRGRVPAPGFVAHPAEVGPMGRSVADVAALLAVMAGPDPASPLGRTDPPPDPRPPFGLPGDGHDLRGVRIGWLGDLGGRLPFEPGVLDVCRGAADVLAGLGAEVVDCVPRFDLDRLWTAFLTVRGLSALVLRPLLDDPATRERLKPEVVWEVERGLALTAADVAEADAVRTAWADAALGLLREHDALLAPSAQVFPFPHAQAWPAEVGGRPMDTYHRWMEVVAPWSLAGLPVLGMPAGFDARGLPMGVQLVGGPGGERRLLDLAATYEAATRWVARVRPPLLASPRSSVSTYQAANASTDASTTGESGPGR